MVNPLAEEVVTEAKKMKGWPYRIGGLGRPPEHYIDCRGLVRKAFRNAGMASLIGGAQPNVRAMVKWAKENGRFRGPETKPPRGCPVYYYEPAAAPEPGNPEAIRHVAISLGRGRAISALNRALGTRIHPLKLGGGYAIYGWLEPDWASVVDDPITDPEGELTI